MKRLVKAKKEKTDETVDKPREVFNLFDKVKSGTKKQRKLEVLLSGWRWLNPHSRGWHSSQGHDDIS